ncbi:ABC-2 type transporter [Haladaptatus paucihalophilus DX253]|uniref:ABC-2 type transport system permease protein n=2 Tax=Haladaptatus TaxID=367188 RepID=E7QTC5_HALPU|nr:MULTISPECIES: ABC transporter permease subunit [Haladaptatus]EFW91854.1 ABC-2 type transporter [Haladaptatus paucihalophilus DX253]GKZ14020.1 copper ABC transporter permease [Haladaptatus sp. T7]SHK81225.1 ABC-2 type transport system permease protein [Haladaptatus paucihalophilus DX253]
MSWVSVARKDFIDSRRSKGLWALIGLYVALLALTVYVAPSDVSMTNVLRLLALVGIFIIPISALIIAYLAIAGERESGSIKFLLGLPNTRLDLVIGKFVGRSAVVAVGLALAFVIAAVEGSILLASVDIAILAQFFLLFLFFAVTYIAIAVGLSAACASRSRAMASSVGVFFVFNVLWTVPAISPSRALRFIADDTLGVHLSAQIYEFVYLVSPPYAFQRAADLVFTDQQLYYFRVIGQNATVPFFLEKWFMLVILAAWLVVPLVLGYWRFERADLG